MYTIVTGIISFSRVNITGDIAEDASQEQEVELWLDQRLELEDVPYSGSFSTGREICYVVLPTSCPSCLMRTGARS